jgi:hypothetical protein
MEVWDLYFCQVVGMNLHPGTSREGAKHLSLEECADLVDEMLRIREERLLCQSHQQ